MRENESLGERVALRARRKADGASERRPNRGNVSTFCYDLMIIVAGLSGGVILLRLLVQALSG